MNVVKLLSVLFLALYLIVVGLAGVGVHVAFVPPVLVGFFALASGVLFLVWGVKTYSGCCGTCDKS